MSAQPAQPDKAGEPDRRPHVVRCHFGLDEGGIESMILRQVPLLNRGGFRVSVCLTRREGRLAGELRRHGVPVHLVPVHGRLDPRGIWRLARFLRSERADIVHAHTRAVYVPATIAARLAGVQVMIGGIHELHSVRGRRRAWQERALDRWRTLMVAVSDEAADDYCRSAGLGRDRCITIRNGIDPAFALGGRPREQVRQSLGIPAGAGVVISVGRLQPQKAHEVLIHAAALLVGQLPALDIRFVIVGGGPLLDHLVALAAARGVGNRFLFLGTRDDVPDLLRAADVTCLTSRWEGFSNVVLESLVMGVPPVVTDAGGARESVQDGVCGFVVPIDDSEAIADRLGRLLADHRLRADLADAARRRSRAFTLEHNVAETAALYARLLARRGAA